MKKNKRLAFVPDVCSCCGQTTNYDIKLSKGTALMVLALYNAVREKGRNRIHVGREMIVDERTFPNYRTMVAAGKMTYKMEGNMTILHRHGLAAMADDEAGVWIMTQKAGDFLFRNEAIPRVAIIDKTTGHKAYYLDEQNDRVTFGQLMKKEMPFWDFNEETIAKLGLGPARTHIDAAQQQLAL